MVVPHISKTRLLYLALTVASVVGLALWAGPSVLVSASVLVAGLMFSAQQILQNLSAGLYLGLEDRYPLGTIITFNAETGPIIHRGARLTVVQLPNGQELDVPHVLLMGSAIIRSPRAQPPPPRSRISHKAISLLGRILAYPHSPEKERP